MSEADFMNASKNGFEFELLGTGATIVGEVPPTAFQSALAEKEKLDAPPIAAGPAVRDKSAKPISPDTETTAEGS